VLRLVNINTFYGNIQALKNVSLHVESQEIVVLIGANGAGKTTLLKTILGLLPLKSGSIIFNGKKIKIFAPSKIVASGISMVPEGRQIFGALSVLDNLMLGAYHRITRDAAEQQDDLESIFSLFPVLRQRKNQMGGTLSGGEQQMLAMGRALMAAPKLLLLDEPSMGLSPLMVREIFNTIETLRESGATILLVEQNVKMALSVADRGYVLETGKIVLQGTREDLMENKEIQRAYLGKMRGI
jgi:branched-chain amino acid transport system ATP-binding protein